MLKVVSDLHMNTIQMCAYVHACRQTHVHTHKHGKYLKIKKVSVAKEANRDGHLAKNGHRREFPSDGFSFL